MAVECLGRESDKDAGEWHESRDGESGHHSEEEEHPHGVLNDAHQGKNEKNSRNRLLRR